MAHFAKLENNKVTEVLVVSNDVLLDSNGIEIEQKGVDFLESLTNHKEWKQTSYNGSFRANYAGIGFYYDEVIDVFIPPKPFNSWVLNEKSYQWEPPKEMPSDGDYVWIEKDLTWKKIN